MTATNIAFDAATREGLTYFVARNIFGVIFEFVAPSWEDGGFYVMDNGANRDPNGNSLAWSREESLDANNPDHVAQCERWYNGE